MDASTGRERTLEAVARLAGGIAHDLNNALLPLLAYGEIALEKLGASEDVRRELEEMLAAAGRATAVTRQLLSFSGKRALREETIDLDDLIARLAERFGDPSDGRITTLVRRHHEPVLVLGDRDLLRHVFLELVVNARAAMPAGGMLTLETTIDGGCGCVVVSDTGHGMDAMKTAHAFDPFFSERPDGDGWGLGLASAYGIVKQSGGSMSVESELGTGTTFVIHLPLLAAVTSDDEAIEGPRAGFREGKAVLLVDDDAMVRASVGRMLTTSGYDVYAASDGAEAVGVARNVPVDVVVTDVAMRGIDGRETADRIRRIRPRIPVLFISGYADESTLRLGHEEGATSFLAKPFGPAELALAIGEAMAPGGIEPPRADSKSAALSAELRGQAAEA
jgi:two-component system, cell cycle sensor histidine kinase and response regulator CckA